jgi:AmmeMemoRadiSam system protein A
MLHPMAAMTLTEEQGRALLRFARARVLEALGGPPAIAPSGEWASSPGAAFVTVYLDGELQGCIGTLEPRRSLVADVGANAVHAAVDDPRGVPLKLADAPRLRVEVSVLGPLEPLPVRSRSELLATLRPGVDGLVLAWRGHRATFLPQVWEKLPSPEAFVDALEQKAGLPRGFWAEDMRAFRYDVQKLREA